MILRHALVPCLFAGVFLAACTRGEPADEVAAIRELDRQWQAAVDARDVEAALAFHAADGIQMIAGSPAVVGTDSLRAWYESWLPLEGITNKFDPVEIVVAASGDLAYDRGTYRFSMQTPDGPAVNVGKYLVVWTKRGGEWKVAVDISNSDVPAQ